MHLFKELNCDGSEFNFQKAASSAKSIYNKSHAGFKRANAVAKKIAQGAAALNKQANFVNAIAAPHKDKSLRKVNKYVQKGNTRAQKANKGVQATMAVANVAKSKLDKALDDDSNNAGVFA